MSKRLCSAESLRARRIILATAIGSTLFALGRWYTRSAAQPGSKLLDRFLPDAEFCGAVSVRIHASPGHIFQALREVTLADMPLATFIGEIRYLPARLFGQKASHIEQAPVSHNDSHNEPFMDLVMNDRGTIVLAEEADQEMVTGSVGKYHNLADQQIVPLHSPEEFMRFDTPGYQKLAMSFRISGSDPASGYRFTLEHRTHALSPDACRKFALYWLGIKPGGNFVSWLMLRAIKRRAEARETITASA